MFPKATPRPAKLSNRRCCYSDAQLAGILRKSDDELTWNDFEALFPVSDCTATYKEQLFFVHLAFAHQAKCPRDGGEYIAGFIQFFIRNAELLQRADLLVSARNEFSHLLKQWAQEFRIKHFDRAACEQKGWSIEYLDLVENSEAITELLGRLLAHEALATVSEAFVRDLAAETANADTAAWFLEIARAAQERSVHFFVHCGNHESIDHPASRVKSLLTDASTLSRQFLCAFSDLAIVEQSPTYWEDLVASLGSGAF